MKNLLIRVLFEEENIYLIPYKQRKRKGNAKVLSGIVESSLTLVIL